jgi:hypothetical protein
MVLLKKDFQGGQRGNIAFGELRANGGAKRVVIGGSQTSVVPGGVDGGHHREKRLAGVELSLFGGGGTSRQDDRQNGWKH